MNLQEARRAVYVMVVKWFSGSVTETSNCEEFFPQAVSPDIHPRFILLSQNLIMLALPRN